MPSFSSTPLSIGFWPFCEFSRLSRSFTTRVRNSGRSPFCEPSKPPLDEPSMNPPLSPPPPYRAASSSLVTNLAPGGNSIGGGIARLAPGGGAPGFTSGGAPFADHTFWLESFEFESALDTATLPSASVSELRG